MAESVFQRALRLLYERRLEQLGLSAVVTVTERKKREEQGPEVCPPSSEAGGQGP